MRTIYWLRRTGAILIAFIFGAAITGNVPDWLKAVFGIAIFGLVLVYDVVDYNVKKLIEETE